MIEFIGWFVEQPLRILALGGIYVAGSASPGVNAGILLLDGLVHSERLSTRYLTVTVASALMFGAIGAASFGLHWSLDKIRGHSIGGNRNVVAELALPWKVVQRVLALMLAFAIVLMASASIAMIGRLRQGFTIFG